MHWWLGRSMKKKALKMTNTFILIFKNLITSITQDRFLDFGNHVGAKGRKPFIVPKGETFSEQQMELVLFMSK